MDHAKSVPAGHQQCPFYAWSGADVVAHQCLAQHLPVNISSRYVASYCTTDGHVDCSIFRSAVESDSDKLVSGLRQTQPQVAERTTMAAPPTLRTLMSVLVAFTLLAGALYILYSVRQDGDEAVLGGVGQNNRVGTGTTVPTMAPRLSTPTLTSAVPIGFATTPPAPTSEPTLQPIIQATTSPVSAIGSSEPAARSSPTPTRTLTAVVTLAPASTPTEVPTPESTNTPELTNKPLPAPTVAAVGVTEADWEEDHGDAEREVGGFRTYENGKYTVAFLDGKVQRLERVWAGRGVALRRARAELQGYLPNDARLVRREAPLRNRVAEYYVSETARDEFADRADELWSEVEPGTIIVLYRLNSVGLVESMAVDVGSTS